MSGELPQLDIEYLSKNSRLTLSLMLRNGCLLSKIRNMDGKDVPFHCSYSCMLEALPIALRKENEAYSVW